LEKFLMSMLQMKRALKEFFIRLPWDLLETIAENPAKNNRFGLYMDSIICNELSSQRISTASHS
jgi:hypothetical protein